MGSRQSGRRESGLYNVDNCHEEFHHKEKQRHQVIAGGAKLLFVHFNGAVYSIL
jgi:hypothetical protein